MYNTSLWKFDDESTKRTTTKLTTKSKESTRILELFKEEVDFSEILDENIYQDSEKYFTSSDEEIEIISNLKINPYFNLLQRLEIQAQESEETVRKRNQHEKIVKHLEEVSEEFCQAIKDIEPEINEDSKFANPLDPEELKNMFRCGDPNDLKLCGTVDVVIRKEGVRHQNHFIESDSSE